MLLRKKLTKSYLVKKAFEEKIKNTPFKEILQFNYDTDIDNISFLIIDNACMESYPCRSST